MQQYQVKVFRDINGNGIFDGSDTGIYKYKLYSIPVSSPTTIVPIITDSNGDYTIKIPPSPDVTLMNSNYFPAGTVLVPNANAFYKYIQPPANAELTFNLAFHPVTSEDFVTLNVTSYNDSNGNGIRDRGERSFPGVEVTVYTYTTNQLELITTDSNGVATKSDLVYADWQAQVRVPVGYVVTSPIDSVTTIPGVLTVDDPAPGSTFNMEIGLAPNN